MGTMQQMEVVMGVVIWTSVTLAFLNSGAGAAKPGRDAKR